jgi:dTDP-4-dehydrorhamnose 3,5-epimerase
VILKPDSPDLISGVGINPVAVWPDDRGYFLEVLRVGPGGAVTSERVQVSCSISYPGTIKAFHVHREQTDLWVPSAGMLQVALVDVRPDSETYGRRNTLYVGSLRPWRIVIPPGVAHGYKVVGSDPAVLVYVTDRFYNPADECRIAYDSPDINYDWTTQYK